MKNIRYILLITVAFFSVLEMNSQELIISSVNTFEDPKHRDDLGTYVRGESFHVVGTYTKETASKVKLRLLTFKEGTWSNSLDMHELLIDETAPFSGFIDHTITIPEDYILKVTNGTEANTQLLQVSVEFEGYSTNIHNFYINVVAAKPKVENKTVDFDAVYGISTGTSLVNAIKTAINNSIEGDTLLFKSSVYDFEGKNFTINKAITISGIQPVIKNTDAIGAYEVATSFQNVKSISMASSGFTIENLKIESVENPTYVFTRISHPDYNTDKEAGFYTNCRISNVIYVGGGVQVYGENSAGITFENVSFLDYQNGGYYCNRKNKVDVSPKVIIQNCKFLPNLSEVNYNVRGISIDAGNDEYPVVWDQSGFIIDGCLFDGQGLGFSKGKNVVITNNHFIGYRKDVDMIHMEEYTNNIHIENNTFEFKKPSRCLFVERGIQTVHDITIVNNTFIGKYHWIFWSNAPYNLRFENNDFTQASANDPAYKTFDFSFEDDTEPVPYKLPMENVVIRNNPGLSNAIHGVLSYNVLAGDTTNTIEGFAAEKIQKNTLETKPLPIIAVNTYYRIRNKHSGEYVGAQTGNTKTKLNTEVFTDSTDLWKVEFKYPYTYTFLNAKTKQYMEVDKGYTLTELFQTDLEQIYVEQKNTYQDKKLKPHFFLRTIEGENNYTFQIAPGGNEMKTRLEKDGAFFKIGVASIGGEFVNASNESVWELINVSGKPEEDADNLLIKAISESCPNQDNGKIVVTANSEQAYKLNLNGQNFFFETELVVEGLSPDTYDFCITIDGKEFEKCFRLQIAESTPISAELSYEKDVVVLKINEGSKPYKIKVNNEVLLSTQDDSININLKPGDVLQVGTSKTCEGLFVEKMELQDNEILLYPNPATDTMTINFGKEVEESKILAIYDMKGLMLYSQKVLKGTISTQIKVNSIASGVYFLKFLDSSFSKANKIIIY